MEGVSRSLDTLGAFVCRETSLFWLDLFHSVVNLSGWYLLLLVLLLYFAGFVRAWQPQVHLRFSVKPRCLTAFTAYFHTSVLCLRPEQM